MNRFLENSIWCVDCWLVVPLKKVKSEEVCKVLQVKRVFILFLLLPISVFSYDSISFCTNVLLI